MKTEIFPMTEKGELFAKAHSMHDCSFAATFEQNTLVLVFDNLENYFGPPPVTHWFEEYQKLTIKYHNTDVLNLHLKYGKKENNFYGTVDPLDVKKLIMYKFSVDSFNEITLDFYAQIKKKLWGGKIEISPDRIEYIWE